MVLNFNHINQNIPWVRLPGFCVPSMIFAKDLSLFCNKTRQPMVKIYLVLKDVTFRGNNHPSVVPIYPGIEHSKIFA